MSRLRPFRAAAVTFRRINGPFRRLRASLQRAPIGEQRMRAGFEAMPMAGTARAWTAPAPCLVAPRGSVRVAVAGFAPMIANPAGVLLLDEGEELTGWDGAGDLLRLDRELLTACARLAGLSGVRPFAQPWLRLRTDEFLRLRLLLRGAPDTAGLMAWLQRLLRGAPAEWRKRPLPRADAFEQRGRFDLAQAVCGFLDQHGHRIVSLAELEGVFGLSSFHVLRVFRRETGLTPHQYALQLRLRRAMLELEDAPPRLRELAAQAGFCSHAHFSSAFRAAWGLTPREYAANFPGREPRL